MEKNKFSKIQIVCKHFFEAVKNNKYSWFRACPGRGDNFMYHYVLSPEFVLKSWKKRRERR